MTKTSLRIIIIFSLIIWLTSSCSLWKNNADNITTSEVTQSEIIEEKEIPKTEKEINEQIVKNKISNIKKRLALRWLVIRWDIYFNNDQAALALKEYLSVIKETPDDENLMKKIWDAYFKLSKYNSAYTYYTKIKDIDILNKDRLILSYIYTKNVQSETDRQNILAEISKYSLNEEETFYYTNSLLCVTDFHGCKVAFDEFTQREIPQPEAWEEPTQQEEHPGLKEIETAIENYRAFQVDQVYYKNALIVWAFYKNGLYPVAIALWEQVLTEKSDYIPMYKIIGKSYFDMWDYKRAKQELAKYYNIDKKDPGVIFLLGEINAKLHEYVLSNIYFNKALEENYKPSIDVRRKLIYNYFLLDNTERILLNFKNMVEQEESPEAEDMQLAIYYHIIAERYEESIAWSNKWLELFPEEEMFYGYLGWIYKLQEQIEKAEENLQAWLEINSKNPMLNLNMWLIQKGKWEKVKALLYFRKAVKENKDWEFWLVAAEELEKFKTENNITE